MKRITVILLFLAMMFLLTSCIDLGIGNEQTEIEYDEHGDVVIPEKYWTVDSEGRRVVKEEYYKNVWSDGCDFTKYYDLFDEATLIAYDGSDESYDVDESLFTESTVVDGVWGDDDVEIPQNAYRLFAIELDEDVSLNDFSMNFYASAEGSLDTYFFVMDDIPFDVAHYDDNLYQERKDKYGNVMYDRKGKAIMEPAEGIFHPDISQAVAHRNISVGSRSSSVYVSSWQISGDTQDRIEIKEGQFLVLLFYSNTAYGKELGETPVSFQPINMLFSIG